jgi:hypothetical protein
MSRTMNIFAWILLGGMATGLGTGFFLYQANVERQMLSVQAAEAKRQAEDLASQSKTLADEANSKLYEASAEVKRAQDLVKRYEEERRMIERAEILSPTSRSRTWKEYLNIVLGMSLRIPNTAKEQINGSVFTSVPTQSSSFSDPAPWLRIEQYTPEREKVLLTSATGTREALFFSSGKLYAGVRGTMGNQTGYVLRVQSAASSTHLIWMQTAPGMRELDLFDVIASFSFRS